MSDIILHHYDISPFSEKVRRILAFKRVPWHAVEQPIMAPKPELTPLTGGYRRIPVMQIGADVYCDTALIVRRLEQLHPEPTVIPAALAGAAAVLEDFRSASEFWRARRSVVTDVGRLSNDLYLKSQGEAEGVASYGRMVDLLLAERRARGRR